MCISTIWWFRSTELLDGENKVIIAALRSRKNTRQGWSFDRCYFGCLSRLNRTLRLGLKKTAGFSIEKVSYVRG